MKKKQARTSVGFRGWYFIVVEHGALTKKGWSLERQAK